MKKYIHILFFFTTLTCFIQAENTILAFPEAEGFGKYAKGGRGGKVVTVTNLQDYTSNETPIKGSFRWALNQYVSTDSAYQHYISKINGSDSLVLKTITVYEPLTVVFNVAGTIWLQEDLKIKRDYLTIAGQTAPGDGICIAGHSVLLNGATGGEMFYWGPCRHDVIIRYMRFRPGIPKDANGNPTNTFVTYGFDIENYKNVIVDHCTMSWANEEVLAAYDTKYTTVQWCIMAEGLYKAFHAKGNRSYCGVWGGQFASYHHNLIAHNNSRNVRFNGVRAHDTIAVIDYRNNVIYNWGSGNSAYGGEIEIKTPQTRNELNIVNNYYKQGPATSAGRTVKKNEKAHRIVIIDQDSASYNAGYHSQHYIAGNYITNFQTVTANNWNYGVQFSKVPYNNDSTLAHSLFRSQNYSPEVAAIQPTYLETAEDAYNTVLNSAGVTIPIRDSQDARIVSETRMGIASGSGVYGKEKGIIDNPDTVGGWPELKGTPYIDTDEDGIPDDWEKEHNLNNTDNSDGAILTASGYSNLELYINSIAPTKMANPTLYSNPQITCRVSNKTLHIVSNKCMISAVIYNMAGIKIAQNNEKKSIMSFSLQNIPTGNYIVHIILSDGTRTVQKLLL